MARGRHSPANSDFLLLLALRLLPLLMMFAAGRRVDCSCSVSAADEFTASLLSVLHTVQAEGRSQRLQLAINRSDYMLHSDVATSSLIPLQVEYNTISVSFAGLATRTAAMHRLLCGRYLDATVQLADLPVNHAYTNISSAIAQTHSLYRRQYGGLEGGRRVVVLMVVQAGEGNAIDQKMLEYELFDSHGVATIRRTLKQLHDELTLDEHKQLVVDGHVAAVAYFRAGYHPRDYPSADEWSALLSIERSLAVKCPNVAQHLSGSKKVQQVLTTKGAVERFVSAEAAQRIRRTFAGLWGLESDNDETRRVVADAIAQPHEYVLKPQREGGGNNLWEDDMVRVLQDSSQSVEQRAQYILMKRIRPPRFETAFVREGAYTLGSAVSELGIYSTFVSDGVQVHRNEFCGHLLRTKQDGVNEGGVAAGFAALDSPILTRTRMPQV